MAAGRYTIRIDDLPLKTIEADNEADFTAKLAAYLRGDGLAHIGDDLNVTVRDPRDMTSTSTVADHRGHRAPG